METAIKIRKPKSQKKKWYFTNGVWIIIKEFMGVKNSKFMNKFLEPLTTDEKSLVRKIKNVLDFAREYPRLYYIVEAAQAIRCKTIDYAHLENLCETYAVDKDLEGLSHLKILMNTLPKVEREFQKVSGEHIVNRIKENMLQSGWMSDESDEDARRIEDEKWSDI
jgi:hypothetical protein